MRQQRPRRPANRARRRFLAGLAAAGCAAPVAPAGADGRDRYAHGLAVLTQVAGADALRGLRAVEGLAPDLVRLTVEFAYGDVVGRPGLSLAERELCTVASLMALGSARPQLHFHMAGFLNVGGAPDQLIELAVLAAPVLGFPAAIDAVGGMRKLFADRAITARVPATAEEDRLKRGARAAEALGDELLSPHPDLARWQTAFQFGEVMGRNGLPPRLMALAVTAMLAAGGRAEALRVQLRSAVRQGVATQDVVELLMQVAVYAGFPAALNGLGALSATLAEGVTAPQPLPQTVEGESRARRMERGLATLARSSAASGEAVVRGFDDLAPDLGRLIIEHSYGEVFSRPGIDPKTRELCAVSALAAVGSTATETPLKVHIRAAANVGATRAEIEEVLLNLESYVGFAPVAKALAAVADEMEVRR